MTNPKGKAKKLSDFVIHLVWMELQDDLVTAKKTARGFETYEDAEEFAATVHPATTHGRILPTGAHMAVSRAPGYEYQSGCFDGRNKWGAIVSKVGHPVPYR